MTAAADVDAADIEPIPSFALTMAQILALAHDAEDAMAAECAGVVLTHLLAAFRVATSEKVAALGPIVVMNDELRVARFATKAHSTRPRAISSSPFTGPVGEIIEGDVRVWYHPADQDYIGRPSSLDGLAAEIVRIVPDSSPTLLEAIAASDLAGLVLEETGGGHIPPPLVHTLEAVLATGIPVVLATRCSGGGPQSRTYAMAGREIDLIARGLIPAGNLSGRKARLRLLIDLASGREPNELFPAS